MRSVLILSCVFAIIAKAVSKGNYCALSCEGIKHIACNNNNLFDKSQCPNDGKLVPMTDSLKTLFVAAHNEKRNFIAGGGDRKHGPACRMVAMKWDDELAELAALNVKQCRAQHDCHATDAFPYSGQNINSYWTDAPTAFDGVQMIETSMKKWYDEVKDSNQQIIDNFVKNYNGPKIGHFTVMMMENNTHVGCAAATYEKRQMLHYLVTCNYATTNTLNEPIYTTCNYPGVSCSSGKHPLYENLCY